MALTVEISTAEGAVFEFDAEYVAVPTEMGEIGIMAGHVPLAAVVQPGLLRLRSGENWESIAIDRGFLLLQKDFLAIAVDAAVNVVDLDAEEAANAKKRAEEALEEAKKSRLDGEEIAQLEAKIRYQTIKQLAKKSQP
ncbi:MAG: ATP synthase F1 subunit epsilon [Puniceicoccales bacterium]|jgi:F-type H+-transporting ATPase subunit epsilon|nr:ATP synthase F1 subunit epsilon [Puniceicoccales bacterium]